MKKFFIFDFDGTLVNTFTDSLIAYNKALKMHGFEIFDVDNVDFNYFIEHMGDNKDVLRTYKSIYESSVNEHTIPFPKISETLKKLDESYDLAICSNRIQYLLDSLTEKFFSDINFKYVVGQKMDGCIKPNPCMINQILDNEVYTKEEVLYVGDRTTDILTAKNVDIDVAIVTWGQGTPKTYEDKYPIAIINKAEELLCI